MWLGRVSTTCDSGWVRSLQAGSVIFMQSISSVDVTSVVEQLAMRLRTHPLSQVVLTSSKLNYELFVQSEGAPSQV